MTKYFRDILEDVSSTVINPAPEEHECDLGRFEIRLNDNEQEIHMFFGDMRTHKPDADIQIEPGNYSAIDDMLSSLLEGDMKKACQYSMGISSSLSTPKIKVERSLTQRMADIEYPFLHYLYQNRVSFVLLNPNKGTLRRCQMIFGDLRVPIFVTCAKEANYEHYLSGLRQANEKDWPYTLIPFADLDRSLCYYCGFTAKKYENEGLKFIGYEINPKYLVTTYDGEYTIDSDEDEYGLYDYITIKRDIKYTYEERYYHEEKRFKRYYSDYVEEKLKNSQRFFLRSYSFLYNVISSHSLPGWDSGEIMYASKLKSVIGCVNMGSELVSPYDATRLKCGTERYGEYEGCLQPIATYKGTSILGYNCVLESPPTTEVDPFDYHEKELIKEMETYMNATYKRRDVRETGSNVVYFEVSGKIMHAPYEYARSTGPNVTHKIGDSSYTVKKGEKVPFIELLKRKYATAVGYSVREGSNMVYHGDCEKVYPYYKLKYPKKFLRKELRNRINIFSSGGTWDTLVFEWKPSRHKRGVIVPTPVPPTVEGKVAYYYKGKYYDATTACVLKTPVNVLDRGWTSNEEPVMIREIQLVKVDDGPISIGSHTYVPLYDCKFPLLKWRTFLRKYDYLHYYAANEYRVETALTYPDDDCIEEFSRNTR